MKLVIDAISSASPGGVRQRDELARSVSKWRPKGWEVVLISPPGMNSLDDIEGLRVITSERPKGRWVGQWLWYNKIMPELCSQEKPDLVYSLNGIVNKKLRQSTAVMVSVNNMLPFSPHGIAAFPLFSRIRFRLAMQRYVLNRSVTKADAVIIYAHHSIGVLSSYMGDISHKSKAVVYGIPSDFKFNHESPPPHPFEGKPYILYFTAIYPYKNHLRLLDAYAAALREEQNLPELLFAGLEAYPGYLAKVKTRMAQDDLKGRVKYLGVLDRDKVPAWLHHATFNIFPSLCETNSFVVVEIIGVGGVLAITRPASPLDAEGGYACEPFDASSATDMKRAILELTRNPARREELRSLSRRRATELTWDNCGQTFWQVAGIASENYQKRTCKLRNVRTIQGVIYESK